MIDRIKCLLKVKKNTTLMRILLLVLANQITVHRFLSGISYLVRLTVDNVELMNVAYKTTLAMFHPLTPVPPVTAPDEPWPFFHF